MVQKQDRQFFFTKKVMLLCVFLFFCLGGQVLSFLRTEDSNQEIELRRIEKRNDRESDQEHKEPLQTIYTIRKIGKVKPSLKDLLKLCDVLNLENEDMESLINKHQVFQLKGKDSEYEPKLAFTNDYIAIKDNIDRIKRIDEILETEKECPRCSEKFTNIGGEGRVFISGCNEEAPHILHYNCYLECQRYNNQCPYCQGCLLDSRVEEMLRNNITTKVFKTGKINHLEKTTDNPSYWKLHLRDNTHDRKITRKTKIAAEDWVIVDEPVPDTNMGILETNADSPKDLEEHHIKIIEGFIFNGVKFNTDKDTREIFLVVSGEHGELEIYHKGKAVLTGKKDGCGADLTKLRIQHISFKRNTMIHIYTTRGPFYETLLVFNKENIDYFKETKGLFIFGNNLFGVYIGLEGDEIITKEDIEDIVRINDEIGLTCDNINNFSAIKTRSYGFLSPIDQKKIAQVRDMQRNTKIKAEREDVTLEDDACFLIPLFDFSATTKYILFGITRQMIERESFPLTDVLRELKDMFTGVEIKGEGLNVTFSDYASILLFYFSEDALKVKTMILDIPGGIGNCELDIIKDFINNQPISQQQIKKLILRGELFDFAVETKIMESVKFRSLDLDTDKNKINDNFIGKEDGLAIIRKDLEKLILWDSAIKHLLYFKKGTNKINVLKIYFLLSGNENYRWASEVLERIKRNGIIFNLPSMDSWTVLGDYSEEMKSKLKDGIISLKNNLESYKEIWGLYFSELLRSFDRIQ